MPDALLVEVESNKKRLAEYHISHWQNFHWFFQFFTDEVQAKINRLANEEISYAFINWFENDRDGQHHLEPDDILKTIETIKKVLRKNPNEFGYFYKVITAPDSYESTDYYPLDLEPAWSRIHDYTQKKARTHHYDIILNNKKYMLSCDYNECKLFDLEEAAWERDEIDLRNIEAYEFHVKMPGIDEMKLVKINIMKIIPINYFAEFYEVLIRFSNLAKNNAGTIVMNYL